MLYKPEEMVFESDVRLDRIAASITTSSIFS
jgi:hypothetical protein